MRMYYNGSIFACQAKGLGSIPSIRSLSGLKPDKQKIDLQVDSLGQERTAIRFCFVLMVKWISYFRPKEMIWVRLPMRT